MVERQNQAIIIKDLRQHFTVVAKKEAARAARLLQVDGNDRATLNQMAETIVNRLLSAPEQQLSQSRSSLAAATKRLFALD